MSSPQAAGHEQKTREALARCADGYSLPQEFYSDPDIHRADVEAVFFKEWLFVAPECELPDPGDFVTVQIDTTPVVILRAQEGELRAFHNSCRHRGSRLCSEHRGNKARLVCPYHQWTYDLDGTLLATRYMSEDFDPSKFPLKSVHVQTLEGLVYICLADEAPDFESFRKVVSPYISPHEPRRTKIAHESVIVEEANWKLVIENNRECYHCGGAHPELLASLVEMALPEDARFGEEFEIMQQKARDWDALGLPHAPVDGGLEFRCIRLPFRKGAVSMTMDGQLGCRKLLGELTDPDLGSVRMFHVPNNWNHFLSDHVIVFRVLPLGPDRTEVRTLWLVHEDAVEGWDYEPEQLSEVWRVTNDQDRVLAEENHKGIKAAGYEPGRYSEVAEFMVLNFIKWYRQQLSNQFDGPRHCLMAAE
ncbi:aromatic ring-hydroxylating dioxygenase subunit alpha [Mesorhizobium sp. M0491]|uniref:aromatic ring-hydroxylating oxygenase subunit alpha n=1 Tax=Mesorhizobium sp. M0491 TaxID=2956950 RepID=UPI003337CA96